MASEDPGRPRATTGIASKRCSPRRWRRKTRRGPPSSTRAARRAADLRAEVEALLAAHARAGEFITPATVGRSCHVWRRRSQSSAPARASGRFNLRERIAHGGMGDVYRAERVEGEFTQQVAIKLIAARLHGADTFRRFRAERQILASLQHPNIVTLVDGGVTADGQPFIVMEYIDGLLHHRVLPAACNAARGRACDSFSSCVPPSASRTAISSSIAI